MTNIVLFLCFSFGWWSPGSHLQLNAATTTSVSPRHIEVTAKRFSFDPGVITLKKGEPVVMAVRSLDVPHGIRFPDLDVAVKASKGSTGVVQFTPEKAGDFVGQCSVFCGAGHGSMKLTLHVVE